MRQLVAIAAVVLAFPATGEWAGEGRLAPAGTAVAAVEDSRSAVAGDPNDLGARWQLLRALHYLSEFTTATTEQRDAAVEEAVGVARDAVAALDASRADKDPSEVARVYFWSAIAWAAHGQRAGLLRIVREGVAGRIFEYATVAAELDPSIERGGPYRLLSRLHADLPRVPFISGWVDRDRVLPLAERAFAVEPEDPGNQLILALALLESAPERRGEAISLLEVAAASIPRPLLRAEDLAIAAEAGELLQELQSST